MPRPMSVKNFKLLGGDCQLQTLVALQRRGDLISQDRLYRAIYPRIFSRTTTINGVEYYLNPRLNLMTNRIEEPEYVECRNCSTEYVVGEEHECPEIHSCPECGNEYDYAEDLNEHYARRHE